MTANDPTPFDVACYCTQSRRVARALTDLYDAALAPSGLKATQLSLLRAVERSGRPTLTALSAETGLDRSTLGRNIRVLEKEGLAQLGPGSDGRTRVVRLTERARSALAAAAPLWEAAQRQIAGRLSPETLDALGTLSRASARL